MFLTEQLKDTCTYQGIQLELDLTFDNILFFLEMLKDKELHIIEKILIGLEMLIENFEDIENLALEEKIDLYIYILENELDFVRKDQNDQENQGLKDDTQEQEEQEDKDYDFNVDGERIYASFLMDYGIDLLEQQGKMHWKKFMSLFSGLSEKTPFMQVVQIRTMDVPSPSKDNQKERNKILSLKRKYALEQNTGKTADEAFENIITAFGGKAGGK
ncbi:bacteriophage Gp15 family protein [Virgibacillus sp. AGTR]|uniref:Gp15 family bacteriophage protein n=1 Tax=Virgibacillus sp. AGTR TaxID=2812055 RepID=UPI001D16C6A7|nr:Gp15 family bacteriophage protein [Virgibacillus sp. AGTR]MCC2250083.1 bacteriophage Gp15 family protein [Virgibacillus sp. AGTR]